MRILRNRRIQLRIMALMAGAASGACYAGPACAQTSEELAGQITALRGELERQRELIEAQQQTIERQEQRIEQSLGESRTARELSALRGGGLGQAQSAGQNSPAPSQAIPSAPVGEAPETPSVRERAEVQAVPEGQGVLTPAGRFVVDPQVEYVNAAANRLVFRGIELVPGIQIGLIEASDVDRDTLAATAALRYGITDRLEAEIRVPWLYRHDRIEVVQQRDEGIVRQIQLESNGIGDVEFGLRYQLNRPRPLRPIWVAQLRVKTDTGSSPFEIPFDEFGVATGLATGSGFWAIQPGLSFLLPSDPVVLYGGLSYLWHLPRDIDRAVGETFIGRVDPGDAVSANVGFGFALNPRFSFSLGYRHSYLMPTETEIGETVQRSNHLQIGALTMGLSYRVTQRQAINLGFSFGVTEDAPDLTVSLRIPFGFPAPWR